MDPAGPRRIEGLGLILSSLKSVEIFSFDFELVHLNGEFNFFILQCIELLKASKSPYSQVSWVDAHCSFLILPILADSPAYSHDCMM